mgnify:CR=1 FL=1|tara:strand:+ start:87 stop:839 length:753 start_codon:yes stop_codon:yes gene_type:complete
MELKRAFNQLAYQLIYPAVLGSIIFDLADPLREFSETRFVGFIIGFYFIIDYLHMTINLCDNNESEHKYGGLIDIIIAFLFCFSYFSLARTTTGTPDLTSINTYYLYTLIFISLAQILIILYEIPKNGVCIMRRFEYYPFMVIIIAVLLLMVYPKNPLYVLLPCTLIFTCLHLYKIWFYKCNAIKGSSASNLEYIDYYPLITVLTGLFSLFVFSPKYALDILLVTLLVSLFLYIYKVKKSSLNKKYEELP